MSGRAAGQRGDREHDPAGAQPAAEGGEPVLGGVQRGGGDPVARGGALGAVGGAAGADAGGDGPGPAHRLGLGTAGVPGGGESAGPGGRRAGGTLKQGTLSAYRRLTAFWDHAPCNTSLPPVIPEGARRCGWIRSAPDRRVWAVHRPEWGATSRKP